MFVYAAKEERERESALRDAAAWPSQEQMPAALAEVIERGVSPYRKREKWAI